MHGKQTRRRKKQKRKKKLLPSYTLAPPGKKETKMIPKTIGKEEFNSPDTTPFQKDKREVPSPSPD